MVTICAIVEAYNLKLVNPDTEQFPLPELLVDLEPESASLLHTHSYVISILTSLLPGDNYTLIPKYFSSIYLVSCLL